MTESLVDGEDNAKQLDMRDENDEDLPSDDELEPLPRTLFNNDDDDDLDLDDLAGTCRDPASTDEETDVDDEHEPPSRPDTSYLHFAEPAALLPTPKRYIIDRVSGGLIHVDAAAAMCSEHASLSSDRRIRVRQGKCKRVQQ